MKRTVAILVVLSLLCLLCSCATLDTQTKDEQRITEMSDKIIRCLTEKDRDAFAALFCEQVKHTEAFEEQLNGMFDFFLGDIYLQSDFNGANHEYESFEKGERIQWVVSEEIVYLKVSCKSEDGEDFLRYYGIRYEWVPVCQEDASLVGLHRVSVELLNTPETAEVGTEEFLPH